MGQPSRNERIAGEWTLFCLGVNAVFAVLETFGLDLSSGPWWFAVRTALAVLFTAAIVSWAVLRFRRYRRERAEEPV